MKFLLLIAHGSRRQGANDEIRQLGERVASLDGNDYDGVVTAFLELAEPDIQQGIANASSWVRRASLPCLIFWPVVTT